jgi:L-ascorbate metabolism protein UlaG (beta-lactamase superfamily)
MVEVAGKKLLFDPFITGNELAKDINVNSLQADYILVSHGHGDHVADLLTVAKNTQATIICLPEIGKWTTEQGYEKIIPMNMGPMQAEFGEVRMVIAGHSSSMPDGANGGNPVGFVIKTTEGNFYYAGDTCLMLDMQLIPKYFAKLDFALLPIGGHFTMNAEDAVIAAGFIECDKIIGVHFDTFGYIKIDHDAAMQAFKAAGKELILPTIDKTIDI